MVVVIFGEARMELVPFRSTVDRFEALRQNLNKSMIGVEIGPFFSPVAPKIDGWNTIVVDWTDGDQLRKIASQHNAKDIRERAHRVEDVDVVWRGNPIDEAVLAITNSQVDFILASHVIEHVPDIIGFLKQCSNMLKPDGVISLAVPDMRKCFDLLKSPTSTAEALAAHREKRVRHTPETIFSAVGYATSRASAGAWVEGTRAPLEFASTFARATEKYNGELGKTASDDYVDAHAWYFTPAGFQLVMLELHALGMIDLAIERIEFNPGSEFIVQLRHRTFDMSPDDLQQMRMKLALRRYVEFAKEVDFTNGTSSNKNGASHLAFFRRSA